MRLKDKIERKVFTTLIEVFPPNFSFDPSKEPLIGLKQKTADVVARVKKVENLCDAILVADMKDTSRLSLASVYIASLLKDELGVEVIPVIPMRDMNGKAVRSLFLTCLSLGLETVSLVWGDRYGKKEWTKNVYDFESLGQTIGQMRALAERADIDSTLLAPVNVSALSTPKGRELALGRITAGADVLLAQPPTPDSSKTLTGQLGLLGSGEMSRRTLFNVFPFRSNDDIESCRVRFGWDIPIELQELADKGGEPALLRTARSVVEACREQKVPGIYLSTRGKPELARYILD